MKPTDADIDRARERGHDEAKYAAVAVQYRPDTDAIVLEMRSGVTVAIPRRLIPYLCDLPKGAAENVTLSPTGSSLYFDAYNLDLHYEVRGLLREVLGLARKVTDIDAMIAGTGSADLIRKVS
jgi:hypothetical protein